MNARTQELETFRKAMEEYIKPLAERFGLTFIEIGDELYALVAPNYCFKFYCAGGHGYSFTVTVAPTYTPGWNAKDEKGFPWLARFVGRQTWEHIRYFDLHAFAQGIADLAAIMPDYLELLKTSTESYWKLFDSYFADEIARQRKIEWIKHHEKNHVA